MENITLDRHRARVVAALADGPVGESVVAVLAGLPTRRVRPILAMLEREGRVVCRPGVRTPRVWEAVPCR